MDPRTQELAIHAIAGQRLDERRDRVAVEEPLELRVDGRALTITMRTPGDDAALARGFLFSEGIIRRGADVRGASQIEANVIDLSLAPGVLLPFDRAARSFTTTSSCGVCGKTSLDRLEFARPRPASPDETRVDVAALHRLPRALRAAQETFDRTGGLHGSALFDARGELLDVREDVGRHNALDKLIGAQLERDALPLHGRVILVSGRASFELVQKAAMAEASVLAAVGAPSSLAVQLAEQCGLTLVGFLRDERFNVYTGRHRIGGIDA